MLERDIVRVLAHTNGIRLASDDRLVALMRKHREGTAVYLQSDGFCWRGCSHRLPRCS